MGIIVSNVPSRRRCDTCCSKHFGNNDDETTSKHALIARRLHECRMCNELTCAKRVASNVENMMDRWEIVSMV